MRSRDALLGNFRTYSEFDSDPIGFFRFSQVEAYVTDSWRANRHLSLEFGVRYQWGLPDLHSGEQYRQLRSGVRTIPRMPSR